MQTFCAGAKFRGRKIRKVKVNRSFIELRNPSRQTCLIENATVLKFRVARTFIKTFYI